MARSRERGSTIWGFLFCALMAGFIVYLVFEIAPSYINNWEVKHALASVAKRPEAGAMSASELRAALRRQFSVGYVHQMSVSKDLRVHDLRHGMRLLVFRYQVRVPIAYNIVALISFVDRDVVAAP